MSKPTSTRFILRVALPALLFLCGTVEEVIAGRGFEDRLEQAIIRTVCAHNGFAPEQVEIVMHKRRFPEQCRTATGITIRVAANDDAIGPVTVRATFSNAQSVIASLPVPVKVMVFDDVLVTNNRLRRHDVIDADDVEPQRVDITRKASWVVRDPDSVVGQWTERTINAGQIVDRRWVAPVPLIRRGDRVTMIYQTETVRTSTTATAMQDGYRDQEITVKGKVGNRLVPVVVIDEATVRPTMR